MWFGVALAAALPLVVLAGAGTAMRLALPPVAPERPPARRVAGARPHHGARRALVPVLQDHGRTRGTGDRRRGEQHLSPVDGARGAQGILLSMAVHRFWRHVRERADPWRGLGHGRGRRTAARGETRRCRRDRSDDHPPRPRAASRPPLPRSQGDRSSTTTPATSCGRRRSATTSSCSR